MSIILEYTQIASLNINNLVSFTMETNIFGTIGINSLNIFETKEVN